MKTIWTSNLDSEDQKERFKKSLLSSKVVLERQTEIINSWIDEIDSIEINPSIYDKASWSALQAHYNGEKRAYSKLLRLINLDKEIDNDRRQSVG